MKRLQNESAIVFTGALTAARAGVRLAQAWFSRCPKAVQMKQRNAFTLWDGLYCRNGLCRAATGGFCSPAGSVTVPGCALGASRKTDGVRVSGVKAARDGTVWIRLPPEAVICNGYVCLRLLRGTFDPPLPAAFQG